MQALREKCCIVVQNEVKNALTNAFKHILADGTWSLESDEDDRNTLNFTYPPSVDSDVRGGSYIRRTVKLEMGAGSDPYPIGTHHLQSYASEEFPNAFSDPTCNVFVLEAERTFWEKATLLHAEYFRPIEKQTPIRLSRHYYDIMQLAATEIGERAILDTKLLNCVIAHKSVYFASNWANYDTAQSGTFHLLPAAQREVDIRHDYSRMQDMFFGQYPSFEMVMTAIRVLE